ncbi:MAG: CHASE2 domain-containing protein [Gammaproteobacteria bacterium]
MAAKTRRSWLRAATGLVLTAVLVLLQAGGGPLLKELSDKLEAIPYDLRMKLSIPVAVDKLPPILIVDVDEESLKREGQWPWSRRKLSQLVERLDSAGAAVIAFDFVFAEKEANPANEIERMLLAERIGRPEWLDDLAERLDADRQFARTLAGKEVVLGFPFHHSPLRKGLLHESTVTVEEVNRHKLSAISLDGYSANLSELSEQAAGSGFFTVIADSDGVIRRSPLVISHEGKFYASLALEVARLYMLEDRVGIQTAEFGESNVITGIRLGKQVIPTDALGQILIPFVGRQGSFPYVPATDVLQREFRDDRFDGAIVLIGTSAAGLSDLRATPVQQGVPGIEIQANIVYGLLHPEIVMQSPDWVDGATVAELALLGLLMSVVYPFVSPLPLLSIGFSMLLLTLGINFFIWHYWHVSLPVVTPLILVVLVTGFNIVDSLLQEAKSRRFIQDMFGQYVPRAYIQRMIHNPEGISGIGDKREMSVLFSDLRNFTTITESLTTPQLKAFLDHYFTPMAEIIISHNGTIDKYVGDMVMAFWGAPEENTAHAQDAVLTALAMQNRLSAMREEFSSLGLNSVSAGIGINSGEMIAGDMGSVFRRSYTVLGDAVNLGSRLESLTKFYDVGILVSEQTMNACNGIEFRYIDFVRVKGKNQSIRIYQPLGQSIESPLRNEEEDALYRQAVDRYLAGDWKEAQDKFENLQRRFPALLYLRYLERIQSLGSPPAGWDRVFEHQSK